MVSLYRPYGDAQADLLEHVNEVNPRVIPIQAEPTIPIIVVTEALAANAQGAALPAPSFVFRQVLDVVAAEATMSDSVFIAPGNSFDSNVSEQEVGGDYLRLRCESTIVVPDTSDSGYVDTRGNARLLRQFLERQRQWPMRPVRLYVAAGHAKRSAFCFRREGFSIAEVRSVSYEIEDEPVVKRLWYYRSRFWHRLYEMGAIVVDFLRPRA